MFECCCGMARRIQIHDPWSSTDRIWWTLKGGPVGSSYLRSGKDEKTVLREERHWCPVLLPLDPSLRLSFTRLTAFDCQGHLQTMRVISRVLCFQCLFFPKLGGVFSGFINVKRISQMQCLFFMVSWNSVFIEALHEWYYIYHGFLQSRSPIQFLSSFCQLDLDQNLLNQLHKHHFWKKLFEVFGIYRFQKYFMGVIFQLLS